MSNLVFFCLSSRYWFTVLPHFELVPPRASIAYVKTISNDIVQASSQLVPPQISRVCHRFGPDLFLYGHKSIVACAFQLCLVVEYITF
jgi:hypothetical protein